jgi:hypothetical protein
MLQYKWAVYSRRKKREIPPRPKVTFFPVGVMVQLRQGYPHPRPGHVEPTTPSRATASKFKSIMPARAKVRFLVVKRNRKLRRCSAIEPSSSLSTEVPVLAFALDQLPVARNCPCPCPILPFLSLCVGIKLRFECGFGGMTAPEAHSRPGRSHILPLPGARCVRTPRRPLERPALRWETLGGQDCLHCISKLTTIWRVSGGSGASTTSTPRHASFGLVPGDLPKSRTENWHQSHQICL